MTTYYGDDWDAMDADAEQAEIEACGNAAARGYDRSRALEAGGDLVAAALACSHGWGCPLDSISARESGDPRAGQEGWRCFHCGSALTAQPFGGGEYDVMAPCEWKVEQ